MFQKLTDLSRRREPKEAFGFYLAYFLLALLSGAILGGVIGIFTNDPAESTIRLSILYSIIYCMTIGFLVLRAKKLTGTFHYIILTLVSGFLAMFGGALLGLIIPSYFSILKKK